MAGQTQLPPGCTGSNCGTAVANGDYPYVFNNDSVDGSFGVTSKLYLRELTPDGRPVGLIRVPTSELNTSFSSKSEGALNLSTDGKYVTFIDYVAPADTVDVSNGNTPGVIDPTNPVPGAYYRAVAQLSQDGKFTFTETNAYSGNNGRAAIEAVVNGKDYVYTAGNAGNGSNPQPDGVILGAGAQIITPSDLPGKDQAPGTPTPVGSFGVTQLGDKADKVGKDDNFRGLTIHNNVLYYTKGSGGNGVNTVYFLDTTGKACPNGTGLPEPGAELRQRRLHRGRRVHHGRPAEVGLQPHGRPVAACLHAAGRAGPGHAVHRARLPHRGERRHRAAVVAGHRRAAQHHRPGQPGRHGHDLGGHLDRQRRGDQGADPNKLVEITDRLDATAPASSERFQTAVPARYDQVVRGVSFAPGTHVR